MIKLKTLDIQGFDPAIHGMRNPKNSWDKSDSFPAVDCGKCGRIEREGCCTKEGRDCTGFECFEIGQNDMKLAKTLASAGSVHAKYRRMLIVWVDITAPLYWWKEFDTYKVGTVANSCSTMHKIHEKEFTIENFSYDHLNEKSLYMLNDTIKYLNAVREAFLDTKDKDYWWQMIQLLPSSYNQTRTVMLNYEVLANICEYRRGHKLDEWRDFIEWARGLPYSELFLGGESHDL
jgi:hypothetical protein